MKIYCDFCGSQIETTENKTCPHCGGYYSTDEELLKEKERVRKLNELDEERKRLEAERLRIENMNISGKQDNTKTPVNWGCLGVLIALSILGAFFILMIICIALDDTGGVTGKVAAKESDTTSRISITHNISLDPIEIPEIPKIEIPEINIGQ